MHASRAVSGKLQGIYLPADVYACLLCARSGSVSLMHPSHITIIKLANITEKNTTGYVPIHAYLLRALLHVFTMRTFLVRFEHLFFNLLSVMLCGCPQWPHPCGGRQAVWQ
jgi:hypothetical protein